MSASPAYLQHNTGFHDNYQHFPSLPPSPLPPPSLSPQIPVPVLLNVHQAFTFAAAAATTTIPTTIQLPLACPRPYRHPIPTSFPQLPPYHRQPARSSIKISLVTPLHGLAPPPQTHCRGHSSVYFLVRLIRTLAFAVRNERL
ncbi:hypothetical protein E2C01_096117 [Portunus trituberculatus]|uniref:Uncharacterized protein n=1 Tax=Portunus trituberculatus TaxID=210409 RepID=A0A5B7JRU8_PORTR|nr:hypothetical protein [Portunus trituberculatus]